MNDSPAMEIALDMVRRSKWLAPTVVGLSAIGWGWQGAVSALYAFVIVLVNFLVAAGLLAVGSRISFPAMAGMGFLGYLFRLALIYAAVAPVRDASWVRVMPLGITLVVTHLGLLIWEIRYVSISFAYPGLKPDPAARRAGIAPSTPSVDRPASAA